MVAIKNSFLKRNSVMMGLLLISLYTPIYNVHVSLRFHLIHIVPDILYTRYQVPTDNINVLPGGCDE